MERSFVNRRVGPKSMANHTGYHEARLQYADALYADNSKLPFRYVFILTNRCNLKCTFCFQDKSKVPGSLDLDGWLKLVDQLPDYAHVTLTGGEPLMFPGFLEILQAVAERHTVNIISNGLLLTEPIIHAMLSLPNLQVLSLSIDDVGNRVRDVRPKQWDKMVQMCSYLVDERKAQGSNLILDTKTVVLDENSNALIDIHRFCLEELQADTHSFMLLKGHPIQHADVMFAADQMFEPHDAYVYDTAVTIVKQLEQVRQYNVQWGKRGYLHPEFVDLMGLEPILLEDLPQLTTSFHTPSEFQPCKAPWESMHVNVEGSVMPCMAIEMGNVRVQRLEEVFFGERYSSFRDEIRSQGTVAGCNRCGYLRLASR